MVLNFVLSLCVMYDMYELTLFYVWVHVLGTIEETEGSTYEGKGRKEGTHAVLG